MTWRRWRIVLGPGQLGFDPALATKPTPTLTAAQRTNSFRETLRAYLNERKSLVLWKDVFDRVDGFPRNGQIDSFELRQVRVGEGQGQGQGRFGVPRVASGSGGHPGA